jgi:hypothetical protein
MKIIFPCVLTMGEMLLGGCVSRTYTAAYPHEWSPAALVREGECPTLAGRYVNAGEMAPDTPQDLCTGSRHNRYRGEWRCETALSMNVGDLRSGDWVELRQPDTDTLAIVSSDPAVDSRILHRSHGDYSCGGQGLERRLHVSEASLGDDRDQVSAGMTGFNAVNAVGAAVVGLGTGGVRTLIRSFRPAEDGALVMAVTRSESGTVLLIPLHEKADTFVRWRQVMVPESIASVAGAAPSELVARFEPYGGRFGVVVTALDRQVVQPVPTSPLGNHYEPVVLAPGEHWLQVDQNNMSFLAMRDFKTAYGLLLQAVAGHAYRLAKRPPSCLPSGKVDQAVTQHQVYRRRVSLIDETRGQVARPFDVDALCLSALQIRSCTPEEMSAADRAEGLACVQLNAAHPGFVGHDADVAASR